MINFIERHQDPLFFKRVVKRSRSEIVFCGIHGQSSLLGSALLLGDITTDR